MHMTQPAQTELVGDLARDLVAQIAPQELHSSDLLKKRILKIRKRHFNVIQLKMRCWALESLKQRC